MNDKQLELIEQKYGKLIHKIGHWISGDNAIASHDDNTQDIWIAAMEAIRGYGKKENQTFDQFWGSVGFDKYLKTCLQMQDNTLIAPETEVFIQEISEILTKDQAQVVKCVLDDPRYIKPSGKVNTNALAKEMGKTWNEVSIILEQIGTKIGNEL